LSSRSSKPQQDFRKALRELIAQMTLKKSAYLALFKKAPLRALFSLDNCWRVWEANRIAVARNQREGWSMLQRGMVRAITKPHCC